MRRVNNSKNKTIREKISLYAAKSPDKAVLLLILLFNISFFFLGAFVISHLAPESLSAHGFWASVYYTITMILDAGCISYVVENVGESGVAIIIICLLIVLIGMITFTGSVIGYITTYISAFIESANEGKRPLSISGHTVILNWNSRASEIVSDLLYSETSEDVVILVKDNKSEIQEELSNRITDIITEYNKQVLEDAKKEHSSWIRRMLYCRSRYLKNRLSIVVREGDILSKAQLKEICIERAKSILILGSDYKNDYKKYTHIEGEKKKHIRGNSNVVKALILVADITSGEDSADSQKIVVEIEDSWTYGLVEQIIEHKEKLEKCDIVPVPVNQILGQLMSQLCVMPQLNQIYAELFSTRGFFFSSEKLEDSFNLKDANDRNENYLATHKRVLPMSIMQSKEGINCFYLCNQIKDIYEEECAAEKPSFEVKLNEDFWLHEKNVVILGHNSGMEALMDGFNAFCDEWNYPDGRNILDIMILDDERSLEFYDYYRKYPYISQVESADIYDRDKIYESIMKFAKTHNGAIAILILSDDQVPNEEIDERPLAFMIYMDGMFQKMRKEDPEFDESRYEIIVEILNPQNYEAVRSYGSNHVVVSNKYISHMMTQLGEHTAIYEFYHDILTYDENPVQGCESKELYLKNAKDFFLELPPKCKAHELVQAVFAAGKEENKSVLLGYMRGEKDEYTLFAGDNYDIEVELLPDDRLIMCSNH